MLSDSKNGDDLPQEAFACQLISMISNIWKKNNIPVWTKRMKILITSANTGLVETITNAMSIHSIKNRLLNTQSKVVKTVKEKYLRYLIIFIVFLGCQTLLVLERPNKTLPKFSCLFYNLLRSTDKR